MADWQTYRNGNPREIWNLERLARHRAAKLGYRVHRSRRRKGRNNAGKFILLHNASSTILPVGIRVGQLSRARPSGEQRLLMQLAKMSTRNCNSGRIHFFDYASLS